MRPVFACADGLDVMMEYLEGVLPAPDRAAVDAHLGGCPRCRAFVKSYLETPRILRAATDVAMPDAVGDSLRRFLAARRRT